MWALHESATHGCVASSYHAFRYCSDIQIYLYVYRWFCHVRKKYPISSDLSLRHGIRHVDRLGGNRLMNGSLASPGVRWFGRARVVCCCAMFAQYRFCVGRLHTKAPPELSRRLLLHGVGGWRRILVIQQSAHFRLLKTARYMCILYPPGSPRPFAGIF